LRLSSGASSGGSSGFLSLSSGNAIDGTGGDLVFQVGSGDTYNGGDITLSAGLTSAQASQGGSINIHGGEGSNTHVNDGGDGGDVNILGEISCFSHLAFSHMNMYVLRWSCQRLECQRQWG
jgi:hypothetical protein